MLAFRNRITRAIALTFVISLVTFVVLASSASYSFSGNIASGAQFDLYSVHLDPGDQVVATLVCDEISPGDRPLDPVLSVYFPGVDSSSTSNANVYDDDGFGSDDSDSGVDCNAFDSSRLRFEAPDAGDYTFRADGFGSATGPYTLRILVNPSSNPQWFDPGDDRINRQAYATASIYCDADNSRVLVLGISPTVIGNELLSVPYADLPPTPTDSNVVIAQNGNVTFYRLMTGEYQVNSGPDAEGKTYVVVWNGCPMTYQNTYILQNGVLTQTEANGSK